MELKSIHRNFRTEGEDSKHQGSNLAAILAPTIVVALCVAFGLAAFFVMGHRRRKATTLGAANPSFQGSAEPPSHEDENSSV